MESPEPTGLIEALAAGLRKAQGDRLVDVLGLVAYNVESLEDSPELVIQAARRWLPVLVDMAADAHTHTMLRGTVAHILATLGPAVERALATQAYPKQTDRHVIEELRAGLLQGYTVCLAGSTAVGGREAIAKALTSLQPPDQARKLARQMLADPVPSVSARAAESLRVINRAQAHGHNPGRALEHLQGALAAYAVKGAKMGADLTTFILVRHGQTEWNRVERFRGQADVPLDETGLAQAAATGARVAAEWQPAAIYSSPLSRTVKTAEAIARHFRQPVQPYPDLIDINYGQWQGLTPDEVRECWPDELDAWHRGPHQAHIPGGESLDELRARAMAAVDKLSARHAGETIVLVGHTVINRIILLGVLGLGNERFWRIKQDTCAINVFEAEKGVFTLGSLNDTCHLHHLGA